MENLFKDFENSAIGSIGFDPKLIDLIVKAAKILNVERIGLWGEEQYIHDFHDMVKAFDDFMPEECRLGSYLNSTLIEPSRLQVGDEVWVHDFHRSPVKLLTISGFGDGTDSWEVGTPYADDVLESVITGKRERVRRYIQNADLIDGKIPLNPKH